ncbi:endoribonuclease translational repressor [Acidovorax phage ACP17]|uniref:Translation repressor protein n=1 Tax=Acidovorax phage ACP17 TaxID=2010329 RepID=A0A218M2W8_9CAUD|nr:endoribonuclease translational repressor [Acidovorax phage ACP17]ASD50392.1 endoribonuclease translational repressor [Acidovorax phage ACP17]
MNEYRENVMADFIEIDALDSDQFLKLKETLTRIGYAEPSKDPNMKPTLWQSVHVFHNKGRYFLVHFKQMFLLDGRVNSTNITDGDLDRLEAIAVLVERWGLARCKEVMPKPRIKVTVIPYAEKDAWNLQAKYNVGGRAKRKEANDE